MTKWKAAPFFFRKSLKLCLIRHRWWERSEDLVKPTSEDQPKPVRWVGSTKEDLSDFPEEVRRRIGGALWEAQIGGKAPYAKPLKGFGGGVFEVVDDSTAILSAPCTRCALPRRSMCSTPFRRNPSAASPRPGPNWT